MHEPKSIKPAGLNDYLETMSKSVFQAGISWKVVDAKWPEIKEAFKNFDPVKIAKFTIADIDKMVENKGVIRNRRKIEAIIFNAQKILELDKEFGGFKKYLRSFKSYDELSKDLKKRFKFLGDMGAYHFLWVVGEKVPAWEEWAKEHGR